jgi:hypothetical protein
LAVLCDVFGRKGNVWNLEVRTEKWWKNSEFNTNSKCNILKKCMPSLRKNFLIQSTLDFIRKFVGPFNRIKSRVGCIKVGVSGLYFFAIWQNWRFLREFMHRNVTIFASDSFFRSKFLVFYSGSFVMLLNSVIFYLVAILTLQCSLIFTHESFLYLKLFLIFDSKSKHFYLQIISKSQNLNKFYYKLVLHEVPRWVFKIPETLDKFLTKFQEVPTKF